MAYNFLGLVNDVNRRLNEVELTESNFEGALGFYSSIKDAVNNTVREINHETYEWPFNHETQEEPLNVGEVRYAFPYDLKSVDMDSFRIKRDSDLGVDTRKLRPISYEEYLQRFVDAEYSTDSSEYTVPRYVFRTPSLEYGVYPAPDKEYEIAYEYYKLNVDLSKATDTPSIPEQFRYVINEGSLYYAYMFRGDIQSAGMSYEKFRQSISTMQRIYVNRYDYVRSTVINKVNVGTKVD
jgi:hypothetical protein